MNLFLAAIWMALISGLCLGIIAFNGTTPGDLLPDIGAWFFIGSWIAGIAGTVKSIIEFVLKKVHE